jgi:hypothetical protein
MPPSQKFFCTRDCVPLFVEQSFYLQYKLDVTPFIDALPRMILSWM